MESQQGKPEYSNLSNFLPIIKFMQSTFLPCNDFIAHVCRWNNDIFLDLPVQTTRLL